MKEPSKRNHLCLVNKMVPLIHKILPKVSYMQWSYISYNTTYDENMLGQAIIKVLCHYNNLLITGNIPPLTLVITTNTLPDSEQVHLEAENKIFSFLLSEEERSRLAQALSDEFKTTIKLDNVKMGSIRVDMRLANLSKLEYLKELSDKLVLTNIVDSILMTPEFIQSCQAEDVAISVIIDEESYQQVKLNAGE